MSEERTMKRFQSWNLIGGQRENKIVKDWERIGWSTEPEQVGRPIPWNILIPL